MNFGQAFENCKFEKPIRRESWSDNSFIKIITEESEYSKMIKIVDEKIVNHNWIPTEIDLFGDDWEFVD